MCSLYSESSNRSKGGQPCVIIYRPPGIIVSQLDLISSWEKKTGRTFEKIHVPEEEIVKLSDTLTFPENIPISILHNIFIKGDQMSFELTEDDLEASKLYPDHNTLQLIASSIYA
ncbi:hypothetical protein GH714_008709 [Hevea brasiliensis]|uniref:NmrA-like domain-containing protein n=1 Tax=Hevea brasiliensis TaxID=3981 RepID=A0A6A6N9Z4_HEVBR|nr:hypothetical protein GH714_008709 [Hevea brasiliensis]